ncbi:DNA-binding protein [Xanthomonas translucens]|uniref:DNA-binding protein n=1 Tax=Xanthomonas campestris pv. translucens TaxID=343 RepID=UPI0019D7099A|nr:DNA-binding protein [Xanthomonas translucens]QSQ62217.1 DNA-binding protein [Xanthomonas translucens pv. undulosa]
MEISKDTRDRIFAAADSLYDQAGRSAFPTVDAVRKAARVNMNDASAGMKEWRRAQTAQAAPVAVQVPEAVQQASSAALASLWQEAQELANESLRAAQAGWDAERVEAETLNKQMADAYEAQATELEAAQARIGELEAAARQAAEQAEGQRKQIEGARAALTDMQQRAATAEARAGELRTELDHAHQEARQARAERDKAQDKAAASADQVEALRAEHQKVNEAAASQLDQVRGELAKVRAKADAERETHQEQRKAVAAEAHRQAERLTATQAERDTARKEAAQAREEAATLRGRLDALETVMAGGKGKGSSTKND